jgi:hypothetical protein
MLFRSRTFLFRAAWFALFAMLATAVMPTASQLVRKSAAVAALSHHCLESTGATPSHPHDPATHSGLDACGFCALHAHHPINLPPVGPTVSLNATERAPGRDLDYQSPFRSIAWSSTFTRGPPGRA